jgi:hypothetical protein
MRTFAFMLIGYGVGMYIRQYLDMGLAEYLAKIWRTP